MLKVFVKLIVFVFFTQISYADTADIDLIFSEEVYVGAAHCSDASGDRYCKKPVKIYDSNGISLNRTEEIKGICVEGGGDCETLSFALESKSIEKDNVLSLVKTSSGTTVWIIYPKSAFKRVEDWVPRIMETSSLFFRPSLTYVYLDRGLTQKFPRNEIYTMPGEGNKKMYDENLEIIRGADSEHEGKKVIEITINYVEGRGSSDPTDTKPPEVPFKRTKIRTIYFPLHDSKGRINYWTQPPSC